MVADYFPKNIPTRLKDGINEKFDKTIFDDYEYGRGKKQTQGNIGERAKAMKLGRSKPSKKLNAKGQDYATRDQEYMKGRNPDGSKRIIPKNKSSTIRPS